MAEKNVGAATPRELGYRMPAEWEPNEATWLAWPHNPEDWPGKFAAIPWLYAEIVRLLSGREIVHLVVEDGLPSRVSVACSSVQGRTSINCCFTAGRQIAVGRATLGRYSFGTKLDKSRSRIGDLMPGRSMTTGDSDDKLAAKAANALKVPSWTAVGLSP